MSTNDLWKKQVSAETREDVRREVANLQAKVDYLKNPRHAPPSAHGASRSLVKGNKRVAKEFGSKPLPRPERCVLFNSTLKATCCGLTTDFLHDVLFNYICVLTRLYSLPRKDQSVIFVASPPVLTFTEYTVGNVYEVRMSVVCCFIFMIHSPS